MNCRKIFIAGLVLVTLGLGPGAAAQESPAEPDPTLREALEKVGADDVEGAIAELEPRRFDGTATPLQLATLGALYLEIGLPRDALDVLRRLAEGDDANPAVLYNAGRAALDLGEEEIGEAYLQRSVAKQPISPAARRLGLWYGARGQTVAAFQLLYPWVLANPDDHEARLASAAAALKLKRSEEAGDLLAPLPAEGDPRTRLLRAELALQRDEPEEALAQLEPLAAQHPPEMRGDVLALVATALVATGRPQAAVRLLAAEGDADPRLVRIRDQARAAAAEADPLAPALELIARGEREAALTVIRDHLARAPRDLRARLLEVRTLVELERLQEAEERIREAIALYPDRPDALHFGAVVKAARGARDEAEQELRHVLELQPDYVPAMVELAQLLAERGEKDAARELLLRVLERHPDDPLARARLRALDPADGSVQ